MRIVLLSFCMLWINYIHAQDTTKLSLLFVGDIMGHDSQIASAYEASINSYDYSSCFQFVKPYIESVDVAIGNLEVTLAGPPYKGYPQFSSPDALAKTLKDIGFDVLVTANNHSVDRGRKGIERTLTMLDSFKILHTGTFADEVSRLNEYPLVLQKNGFTIVLLNYTYGTNGIPVPKPNVVNMIDTALIRKDLLKSRDALPDVTIVFMHWGAEYQSLQSKGQKDLANFCFKNGADLVIGAHPHVVQPMEWRKDKNKLVVYSLGNFVSGQRDRYKNGGAMVHVGLSKIRYKMDSTVTSIDSAGYYLEWVYRTVDSKKDYYIIPIPTFEGEAKSFIKDTPSQLAFETFAADSRKLFRQHNINMNEIKTTPPDSVITYRIEVNDLFTTVKVDAEPWAIYPPVSSFVDVFYGYTMETDATGNIRVLLGNFSNRTSAERAMDQFVKEGKNVRVVRYVNASRAE